ncbi:hypothetical protein BGX24_003079 [Mortierella sp. AD032]|nr:hypothetical protein BGX24_003079 [Mortierella sp. AD032]
MVRWTNIPMPHLQELTLRTGGGSSDVSGESIILQCPNLKTLRWSIPEKLRMPRFTRILAACPLLKAIEVRRAVLIDLVISTILDSLKLLATEAIFPGDREAALKGDSYGFYGFRGTAFEALRRHFLTLVVLDIGSDNTAVDSISILKVLYSCPNLRKLTAYRLEAMDICSSPLQHQEQQRNWACRGLEVFKVMIGDVSPSGRAGLNMGDAVLRRFAALSRLRVLHVGGDMRFPPPPYHLTKGGLVLKLHQGLGHLAGLTRLESVSVGWFEQHLEREQVEWMKRHWTGLKVLEGVNLPCDEPIVSEAIQWALPKVDTKKWLEERENWFRH